MRTRWLLLLDDDRILIALELSSVWRSVRLVKFGPISLGIGVNVRIGKVMQLTSDMLDVSDAGDGVGGEVG